MHAEHRNPILYRDDKADHAQRGGEKINPERESDLTKARPEGFGQHRTQHGGKHTAEHEYGNHVGAFMQDAVNIIDDGATANYHRDQHHKIVNGKNTPLIVTK